MTPLIKRQSEFSCGAGVSPASLDAKQNKTGGRDVRTTFFHSFSRPRYFGLNI
jgi:hypothetical protein